MLQRPAANRPGSAPACGNNHLRAGRGGPVPFLGNDGYKHGRFPPAAKFRQSI
jgi:hypothetical protein